jgi:hypothetical protein
MTVEPITKPQRAKPQPDATLWEAFAAAQSEFGPIIKNTKGARGNYAPLDAVLETVRPILNKHGLALTQATFVSDGTLFVRSSVVHVATGEHHDAEYPAGGFALQHQQLGAGVTYARRYSLLSILGVFPENEDDDGEKAGAAGRERSPSHPQPRQQQKIVNPETGRMIDPNNARNSRDKWTRFCERVRGFTDLDDLEAWWADASTQAAIEQMPWANEAAEEYEKKQEALLNAGAPR